MGRNDNLITGILSILIIGIFIVTVYFCLDIFGIIEVPEEYSIAKFFGTKITDISVAEPIEEIINEKNIDEWINQENELIDQNLNTDNTVEKEGSQTYTQNYNDISVSNITTQSSSSNVVNRMYYSQLDIYGRMIYNNIKDNIEKLKTGTYVANFDTQFNDLLHEENGSEVLEKAFQLSINAFLFDHPEIFYLDITKMYMSTEIISFGPLKTYRVKIGPLEGENYLSDFFNNETTVNVAIQELENIRENIKLRLYGDTYLQVKIVHDYLISNIEYDQTLSRSNIYTTYGALKGGSAVCEGYSKALKYVLDDLEIPCVVVCGTARNSNGQTESHAWNYVKIDDNWYAVDPTWDDPLIIGEGYVSQDVYKRYLLKGSREFFEDHFEDGNIVEGSNFVYPTISQENYR